MHVIHMNSAGMVSLLPCSSWFFTGEAHPNTWMVRATVYGPSTSTTYNISHAGVVYMKWGSTPGQRYNGVGPLSWAALTSRLQSETERSLADEAGGDIAQIIPLPAD